MPTPPRASKGKRISRLDDAGRRKQGVPRVDRHVYARENGLAITGLAALYAASGDAASLADARRAAEWVIAHRALPGGGFRHDASDAAGPYLADTLEMGRAFLALYTVTAERPWLARAEAAADFIDAKFRGSVGYATAAIRRLSPLPPQPEVDENVTLARFANLLGALHGEECLPIHGQPGHALLRLSGRNHKEQGYSVAGILLANRELNAEPVHVTIAGAKDDPAARALFATAAARRAAPTRASSGTTGAKARSGTRCRVPRPAPGGGVPLHKWRVLVAVEYARSACAKAQPATFLRQCSRSAVASLTSASERTQ